MLAWIRYVSLSALHGLLRLFQGLLAILAVFSGLVSGGMFMALSTQVNDIGLTANLAFGFALFGVIALLAGYLAVSLEHAVAKSRARRDAAYEKVVQAQQLQVGYRR